MTFTSGQNVCSNELIFSYGLIMLQKGLHLTEQINYVAACFMLRGRDKHIDFLEDIVVSYTSKVEIPISRYL